MDHICCSPGLCEVLKHFLPAFTMHNDGQSIEVRPHKHSHWSQWQPTQPTGKAKLALAFSYMCAQYGSYEPITAESLIAKKITDNCWKRNYCEWRSLGTPRKQGPPNISLSPGIGIYIWLFKFFRWIILVGPPWSITNPKPNQDF